jgi:UDP-GlcNAc:undecaprenyl-phosphate/decaprenyl-phosphate GlcNAc-1-phosphate transferase
VRDYLLTLFTVAAVTYLLTPLVRRVAIAFGAMHDPRERDVHLVRTPRMGGLAMYFGLAAGLLVASQLGYMSTVLDGSRVAVGLLLAGGLLVVVGIADDRWGLGVIAKAASQVAAGGILVWSGAELSWIPSPHGNTIVLSPNQGLVLTILVVVVTINAINFIDGLDGLAAGVVAIAALAFFAYSYSLLKVIGAPTLSLPVLVSAILAGMCLGFLPHNFHPARIFMGDTGSMLLGLLLAYGPISSTATLDPSILVAYGHNGVLNRFPTILPILLPAAIFLIPYTDLLLAVVRRTRAGTSVFQADKKHLHHRLMSIGHSQRKSVLIMYLWAALFAVAVVSLSVVRTPLVVLAVATVVGMLILLMVTVPWLRPRLPGRRGPVTIAAQPVSQLNGSASPAASSHPTMPPAAVSQATAAPAGIATGTGNQASAAPGGIAPGSTSPADVSQATAAPAGIAPGGVTPGAAGPGGAASGTNGPATPAAPAARPPRTGPAHRRT